MQEKFDRINYPSNVFKDYWTSHEGLDLMKNIRDIPTKEQIDDFSHYYLQTDNLADEVINEIFSRIGFSEGIKKVSNALSSNSIDNDYESLDNFISHLKTIPKWFDLELANEGSKFSKRTGGFALIILRNLSLIGGYESSAVNKPLIYTTELKNIASKRIAETLDFWVDVTKENALLSNATGFQKLVKVRLVHAFARKHILKTQTWKINKWGLPINQFDMMVTNLGFSLVFLTGLKKLGFKPTVKEEKGVYHLWKYIGYLQGIPLELLPDDEVKASELLYIWTMTQPDADKDSIDLAQALINIPLQIKSIESNWKKNLLYKINLGFMNYFLPDSSLTNMQIPSTKFIVLPKIIRFFIKLKEVIPNTPFSIKLGEKQQEQIRQRILKTLESDMKLSSIKK